MLSHPPEHHNSASTAPPAFSIEDDAGSVHVVFTTTKTQVFLAGDVDVSMRGELDDALTEIQRLDLPVEIDVIHLTFIDSTGIAFLARTANGRSPQARLVHATQTLRFLLKATGVEVLLDISDEPTVTSDTATRS